MILRFSILMIGFHFLLINISFCEDWPTYMHDNARSGVTGESVTVPMKETWVFQSAHKPQPAWPAPAKRDYWHHQRKLRPLVTFDRAFHPVIAGDALFFGSSADDQLYCLDSATGKIRWTFFTEGPIRLAPTVYRQKVYFGSDDGWIYCLDTITGKLLWKHHPAPEDRRLPGNGRMISLFPIRSGVLVDHGIAYCFAGLFPMQGVYRCALDAEDGSIIWNERVEELSPQGYLIASPKRLFVPTGRTSPAVFDRESGSFQGTFETYGGAYTLLTGDAVISGPGRRIGKLSLTDSESKERFASFDGLRIIVHNGIAYMLSERQLAALDRNRYLELARQRHSVNKKRGEIETKIKSLAGNPEKEKRRQLIEEIEAAQKQLEHLTQSMEDCYLWKRDCTFPYAMILANDTLFVGGEDMIAAFRAYNGAELWTAGVSGRAYGLAVANERLYVSTDQGMVYCFSERSVPRRGFVRPVLDRQPYPPDKDSEKYKKTVSAILQQSERGQGYCLILDSGEGRLAYELAKQTDWQIIGLEDDANQVRSARKKLNAARLYGNRISIHEGSLADIHYVSYFANQILSDQTLRTGQFPSPSPEISRLLKPNGGILAIGRFQNASNQQLEHHELETWIRKTTIPYATLDRQNGVWINAQREKLSGEGEWTHLYANPANTACSQDTIQGRVGIQWFGKPGPRNIIDRHHRPMSPLFKDGRLFISANDRIITTDAYNGTRLWEVEVPFSRRIGALKDCGYMVVDNDYLYVTQEDQCHAFRVEDGQEEVTLSAPQIDTDIRKDWGYIASVEDQIFGSCTKAGASFYELSEETCGMLEGDFREMILCDYLFSLHRKTGEQLWLYKNGVIFNNTIAIGDEKLFLVESRNETTTGDFDGRISPAKFCGSETYLIALDLKSGDILWEQPFLFPFEHIMFLSYSNDTLLSTGTYNQGQHVHYGLFAFDAATGELKWKTNYQGDQIGGTHGEQWQHPVIIEDTIYSRPYAFDLLTGEQKNYTLIRGGGGCGGLSASANYLFGRGSNPRFYPLQEGVESGTPLTLVNRPGCWINIIPAGGLILLPESSSGCTCAYPMQLSIAFSMDHANR